jgi:predicted CopG family antitoxin
MGTKTIGLREDAYERLKARKREGESFTELVERLLDEATADWRDGFGTLPADETDELEQLVRNSRNRMGEGVATRQRNALEDFSTVTEDSDETA